MNNLNFASRKFILTILYAVIFVANYAVKLEIPWEALATLGVMFGIYNVANAVEGAAYAPYDAMAKEVDYDQIAELVAEAQCEALDIEEEEKEQEAHRIITEANAGA